MRKLNNKILFPFIGIIVAITSLEVALNLYKTEANKNKEDFFLQGFSTKIVSSNSYAGRTIEFHLINGLKIYFLPPVDNKIMIGDSIKKQSNTYLYNVYRKNMNNNYDFFATYDFRRFY